MASERIATGVAGLDEVLHGGLLPRRAYLVRGAPGTGKTTLGLHFLTAGAAAGEATLLISLDEPEEQLRDNATRLGFDLSRISLLDLSPTPEFFTQVETYDLFAPAEVEREPLAKTITARVEALQPQRIFIDAMTQLRYLAPDPYQFRKQVRSLLRFLVRQGATVLFSSEASPEAPDHDLQFLSDGILTLEMRPEGRFLHVVKFRGSDFAPGPHALRLDARGLEVLPRLVPEVFGRPFAADLVPSGVPELDELLGGGLERGTVALISGPTGVGKTTLGMQFAKEAAGRGERTAVYLFEERLEALLHRCQAIGIPVHAMVERGTLAVVPVEPLRLSPDELALRVRQEVEAQEARLVLLDSLAGYRLALRGGDLESHLHALSRYLKNMGVTTLLVNETEAITGDFQATEAGLSHLADTLLFLRYLEIDGELRRAIGVLKKRLGDFEKTLREFTITRYGLRVGPPLRHLRGILSGLPQGT
ncbi:MAG: serine/threonine protein kinase [Candidatus Tectimicrobiota bacterium]|nr:MAG: serine/threonine protein kinase [Candidatus Tectomicrobia bacterium]